MYMLSIVNIIDICKYWNKQILNKSIQLSVKLCILCNAINITCVVMIISKLFNSKVQHLCF